LRVDLSPRPALLEQARPSRLKRVLRRLDAIFVLTVLLPTLAAGLYYGLMASDVYISESRFVVRSPQRQVQTGLGALLQSTGFARSQDDTYSVLDFIRSRDALRKLDAELKLRAAFGDPGIDVVNRFPGIDGDDSFESLYKHYLKHVDVTYDTASSIAVLRVRAYKSEDAFKANTLLLQMGERLVNDLNTRSRTDIVAAARQEVTEAEERAKAAAAALSGFRAKGGVFDPERQGNVQLQSTARLREELLAAETQLAQIRQVSPANPQIAGLQNRVDILRRAIGDENARLVGQDAGPTAKLPVFDRLSLEKQFADRQLVAALAALDAARAEAQRKLLYLERLVQPNQPDSAMEPRRLRSVVTVFLVGLVLWGVVSLVVSSVREHVD
jgi:capsular polysaccharide transport system permease protein